MRAALCAAGLFAAGAAAAGVVVEPAAALPQEWREVGATPRSRRVELIFAVRQQGAHRLHDALMRTADPASSGYGQHLTNDEVHAFVAPAAAHVRAVEDHIAGFGASPRRLTPNGDMVGATVPVGVAEAMLAARYVELAHNSTAAVVHRTPGGYSLPAHVAEAVDFVAPTVHVPAAHAPLLRTGDDVDDSEDLNTPKTLRQLYSVGAAIGKAATNKQAVTAFLGETYSQSALQQFWKKYCGNITCGKGLPTLVGDATTGPPKVESMLDIEIITGVAGNIDTEFWGFSGVSPSNPENEPFMKWLAKVSSTPDAEVPKLFSTSYGEGESTWSEAAGARLNTEFMKAGARGISLLYSSGDYGANCKDGLYHPVMPASSPYVTAVGGTRPTPAFPGPGAESAIALSSGGFSNYWPMPSYQANAVTAYLEQEGLPPASFLGYPVYNASGRAFPDIAAQATNFCVEPFGCNVYGTSCSSPTAAGVVGLLNDLRLQSGKSSLGFLNPLIYKNAAAFNDITTGSSRVESCNPPRYQGWPAKKGWDAVTGLGTPNYAKLAAVVKRLP